MRIAVIRSLDTVVQILVWLILLRAIMSWIRPDPRSAGGDFFYRVLAVIHQLTEPLLAPLRRLLPGGGMGGLDLTPLIVLIILQFLRQLLWSIA